MEPNPSKYRAIQEGDNTSFQNEFIIFNLILTVQFISVSLSKYWSIATPLGSYVGKIAKFKVEVENPAVSFISILLEFIEST
jgi:hypothetical protein